MGKRLLFDEIGRRKLAQGVFIHLNQPTIVFVTVCTHNREPWLAQRDVHEQLRAVWQSAQAWLVGYYILMPDHAHLFCAPRDLRFTLEKWITFWKSRFSIMHQNKAHRWQASAFHHRLRREEGYAEKWNYVRENPVRKGLVKHPDEWPFQGQMNILQW